MDHFSQVSGIMEKEGVDGLLLTSRENKFYTAGLYSGSGCVLVTARGVHAIVDGRYYLQQKERTGEERTFLADSSCSQEEWINRILAGQGVGRLGFEASDVSYARFLKLRTSLKAELAALEPDVMRIRKDEMELSCIRRACEIADRGYSYILEHMKAGMTERQVENSLLFYMKSQGAQKESFDIIVASGTNGAMPHAKASDKVIQRGELVTMDFGARYGEYCSDLTRTVMMGDGEKLQEDIYQVVLSAQQAAVRAIRPGIQCCEVDAIARGIIEKAGYGEYFTHNLGHGLGIRCHEAPDFSPEDSTVLFPGMVMTVEPGIYIPHTGGVRIEDDILVTETGCEVLTKAPRQWTRI